MKSDQSGKLTRRQFLTRTALASSAAALPTFIPAHALGRDGAVAPSNRIVMGGIGLGGRGSYDLGVMIGEPDVQWVAVCDAVKGRRDAAKNTVDGKYGNKDCATYIDFREVLARPDIDAIIMALGDRWHTSMAVLAMRAGNYVSYGLLAGVTYAGFRFFFNHRLFDIPFDSPWTWAAIVVLDDFAYYWFHRWSHEVRFWWAAHVNHHSSQHYNLSTALRQSWTSPIALSFIFRIWPALRPELQRRGVSPTVRATKPEQG